MPMPRSRSRSRSRVRIPISQPGALSHYGYFDVKHMSANARHRALAKAIRAKGAVEVIRRLNALSIFQKRLNPSLSAKIRADQRWASKKLRKSRSRLRSRSR